MTESSWPLAHASMVLVGASAACYFASFVLRARGWHRLFPTEEKPDHARCLASVGAAAASGVVLPFRLDYLIKIGTLRKLGGIPDRPRGDRALDRLPRHGRRGRDAAALDLRDRDELGRLPRSRSLIVVPFGLGCFSLLVASSHLIRLPLLGRSARLTRLPTSLAPPHAAGPAGPGDRRRRRTCSAAGRPGPSAARCS